MIREVIVVEGRDDLFAVKKAVEAEVIVTGGFGLNWKTLDLIRKAAAKRGVIILTDPDYAGERIRDIISSEVPGCKHAFLSRVEATGQDGRIGVENASADSIRKALLEAKARNVSADRNVFTLKDLLDAGLVGSSDAQSKRTRLGERLGIGTGSAKKMLKRLNNFEISREEFEKELQNIEESE
jgi:ribonuclease M5